MFTYTTSVKMHDTDAAGVIYFASFLRMAHEAFESFLMSTGRVLPEIIQSADFILPIVHTEADYTAPLFLWDNVRIEVTVDHIGNTSFTILYRFVKAGEIAAGSARTVHVAVDKSTHKKRDLPDFVRSALEKLG